MKRIDRLQKRVLLLTARQNEAQQKKNLPHFILHLDDESTVRVVAHLPEGLAQLVELHALPTHEVKSIERPQQLDSRTEKLYDLFKYIVVGGVSVSETRAALLVTDDHSFQPPKVQHIPAPERNHNLI